MSCSLCCCAPGSLDCATVLSVRAVEEMAEKALSALVARSATPMTTICEFSLNRPPMRPKVDRQSYDELKPGIDRALELLDWYSQLQQNFVALVRELAQSGAAPSPSAVQALVDCIDLCVVLENQFGGWSACINRFSWFKRTFSQIRREVAQEVDCEKLTRDLSRFQAFIGACALLLECARRITGSATHPPPRVAQYSPASPTSTPEHTSWLLLLCRAGDSLYPIGTHLTGPLRREVQKVHGSGEPLLAVLHALTASASGAGAQVRATAERAAAAASEPA